MYTYRMHPEIVTLGVLGAIASGAFGWFFSWYATIGGYDSLVIAVIFALIYLSLLTLRMLMTTRPLYAWICIACDIVLFLLSFIGHFSLWLLVIGGITNAWLYFAWREGRRSVDNMLHIRLRGLTNGFIKSSFRAILFLGIASYLSLINPDRIAISRTLIAGSLEGMINGANRGVIQQIVGRDISPEESATVIQKMTDGVHTATSAFIDKIPPNMKTGLLIGLGVIIFLLASSVINIFLPLVMGFVWGVMQLLLRFKIITIKMEKVDKEVIVL